MDFELNESILKKPNVFLFPSGKKLESKTVQKFTGPISGPMWKTVESLNSNYKDTFDWAIYDRLLRRFEHSTHRGGVVYNTDLKLVNHHASCSKCHYALEVDTYGRGCVHNCLYCYAKDTLTSRGWWNEPMPFPVNLANIRKIFHSVFETDRASKWRPILEKCVPLRIGSMSDSFMWIDRKYKVTQELLKILSYYNYPYIVFTRSDLIATDEYLALIDPKLASVQFSISGPNEEITRIIEPGAPSVLRRLRALEALNNAGIWTTVRLNPLFPTFPDGYFSKYEEVIKRFGSEENIPKFSLFDINNANDFMSELRGYGVKSLLTGFVRLSTNTIKDLTSATGVPLRSFFYESIWKHNGDKHYSNSEIKEYYTKLKNACTKNNIRFNTCYIGNGIKDYFQYQDLWSNKAGDCCDAKTNVKSFGASSQDISWKIRSNHSPCKTKVKLANLEDQNMTSQFSDLANPRSEKQPTL